MVWTRPPNTPFPQLLLELRIWGQMGWCQEEVRIWARVGGQAGAKMGGEEPDTPPLAVCPPEHHPYVMQAAHGLTDPKATPNCTT